MKKLFSEIPKEVGDFIDELQRKNADEVIKRYKKLMKERKKLNQQRKENEQINN